MARKWRRKPLKSLKTDSKIRGHRAGPFLISHNRKRRTGLCIIASFAASESGQSAVEI
jgi:hypothetical protein